MLKKYFTKYWYFYLVGVLFLFISSYLQTLAPAILGKIVDLFEASALRSEVFRQINSLLLASASVFATKFIWRYCLVATARKIECGLREDLFHKLQRLPRTFYNSRKTGELMAYAINDINAVRMIFGPALAQLCSGVLLSTMCIINMFRYGTPVLVLFTLIPILTALFLMRYLGRLIRTRFTTVQKTFAMVSDRIQESIMGIRVIKAYAREDEHRARFETLNQKMQEANVSMVKASSLTSPTVTFLFGITFSVSLILGGNLVKSQAMSLGDFIAYQGYIASIVAPVLSITRLINTFQRGSASMARLNEVLSQSERIFDISEPEMKEVVPAGDLRVENLTFTYEGAASPSLKDISFTLPKGATLGIIGRTGCGKTTLANLLIRLYEAPDQTIFYDGRDIKEYSLSGLRAAIGYVPQDGFLFSSTIEENLYLFGDKGDEGQLKTALKTAQIADLIVSLPDGLQTMLGERGVNLSGGQQQRLSIARALLKNANLLLFDDAFSSVDTKTEEAILWDLKENYRDLTKIIIAHRISAVKNAELILVMDRGRIIEQGSHEELIRLGGTYARLYQRQTAQGGTQV